MRLEIKSIPRLIGGPCWWYVTFDKHNYKVFPTREAAIAHANKIWKRYTKEQSAFARVSTISVNLLSIDEAKFVAQMIKSKCAGITKKQYGYLKGIHERQEREW